MAKKARIPANKDVLIWARNVSGLTREDAGRQIGISEQELTQIELGRESPTTAAFKKMVTVYKQTESTLLLERPPTAQTLPKDYRTAEGRRVQLSPNTRLAIRDAQELQRYVSEIVSDDPRLIKRLQLPSLTPTSDPEREATKERGRIGVPLSTQLQWKRNEAFDNWRDWLGRKGILVLLKRMPWEDCRGFSLLDHELVPTVVVNAADIPAARIFTLFHEYAHLTLHSAGICTLTSAGNNVERWCNLFAAAFLLPAEELTAHAKDVNSSAGPTHDWSLSKVGRLANYYRVSVSVMALRLQSLGLAIPNYYDKHKAELRTFDKPAEPTTRPKIKRKPGWKEKRKLKEVGITAASVIVDAWREQIVDATEAADILNLSLDELHGLQKQTEVQRVRNVG